MSGGTLAWGIAFAVLCVVTGMLIGWPLGHARGLKHASEYAWDDVTAAVVADWKGLPGEDARPSPPWPPAGPGKHRHPAGPRHAELPAAGYLPAGPWDGQITVPAPAQAPPWDQPEPVLEPTAVLSPPVPDPRTDTAWTREMVQEMDAWIAEHITATDPVLKEITGGAS